MRCLILRGRCRRHDFRGRVAGGVDEQGMFFVELSGHELGFLFRESCFAFSRLVSGVGKPRDRVCLLHEGKLDGIASFSKVYRLFVLRR